MDGLSYSLLADASDGAALALRGALTIDTVGALDAKLGHELAQATAGGARWVRLDLAGIGKMDTAGAWLAWRLAQQAGAQITGASPDAQRLLAAVASGVAVDGPHAPAVDAPPCNPIRDALGRIGDGVMQALAGLRRIVGFYGELLVALWHLAKAPRRIRWIAIVRHGQLVGVNALGIVALMSFLVGIVIAQQGAVQLQQFGAEIYTVNLTGRIALRELGTLMTAIMVAGRSGSAFAAQIEIGRAHV